MSENDIVRTVVYSEGVRLELVKHGPIENLRLLIQSGDLDTPEARRLILQVGNMIPSSAERDRLWDELQDTIEVVRVAEVINAPADGYERRCALAALADIEAAINRQP